MVNKNINIMKYVASNATYTRYQDAYGNYHREDGPAHIMRHNDGRMSVAWLYHGKYHRYGGPSIIQPSGKKSYYLHGNNVTDVVNSWLEERGYVWEDMSDIEKWELDMFMRSLG